MRILPYYLMGIKSDKCFTPDFRESTQAYMNMVSDPLTINHGIGWCFFNKWSFNKRNHRKMNLD